MCPHINLACNTECIMNPSLNDIVITCHLLVSVDTGQDEEYSGPLGASNQKSAQPEDDSSLILLEVI